MIRGYVIRRMLRRLRPMKIVSIATGLFIGAGGLTLVFLGGAHAWTSIFLFIPASLFIILPFIIRRRLS